MEFDKHFKNEVKELMDSGLTKEEAEAQSPLMLEAREMLRKWEAGDNDVRSLWQTMNGWVYEGFDETYKRLGVGFDKSIMSLTHILRVKTLCSAELRRA